MTAKTVLTPDIEDALSFYRDGASIADLARKFGKTPCTWQRRLKMFGIAAHPRSRPILKRRIPFDTLTAVKMVIEGGMSVKQVARQFRVQRSTIVRTLKEAGHRQPNRSEGMKRRMAETSPAERKQLSKAAHDAVRGSRRSDEDRAKRARGVQRTLSKVGRGEEAVLKALAELGLQPIWQQAIGRYNIDIGLKPVAVEIWSTASHPFAPKGNRRKIKYLLECGWSSIWVWSHETCGVIGYGAVDKIVAFLDEASRFPAGRSEHRVVGSNGDLVRPFRLIKPDPEHWPFVPAPTQP